MSDMEEEMDQYYQRVGIAPVYNTGCFDEMFSEFNCCKKDSCRDACYKASKQAENFLFSPPTQPVKVSQYYKDRKYKGNRIPRIVVVSLSLPQPEGPPIPPTEKKILKKKQHWTETLAMVRSLLHHFISPENFPKPVTYWEDLKGNQDRMEVEDLFVHARTAKCCSTYNKSRQEPSKVYANCGPYFSEELRILEPDVIVTQGNPAHWAAETHAFDEDAKTTATEAVNGIDLSIARIVNLKHDNAWKVYWLRTVHPAGRNYYSCSGLEIDSERNVRLGAMRENFVRYGEEIKKFMDAQGR